MDNKNESELMNQKNNNMNKDFKIDYIIQYRQQKGSPISEEFLRSQPMNVINGIYYQIVNPQKSSNDLFNICANNLLNNKISGEKLIEYLEKGYDINDLEVEQYDDEGNLLPDSEIGNRLLDKKKQVDFALEFFKEQPYLAKLYEKNYSEHAKRR